MSRESESPIAALAAFLVFFATAFRLTFSAEAAGFLHNALADLIVFSALAFALASLIASGARPLRVNLAAGALLFFCLVYLVSGRASYYPRSGLLPVMNTAALGCLFLAASGLLLRRGNAGEAAAFVVGLFLMSAAAGLYQYWELPRMLAELRGSTPPFKIGHVVIDEKNFADFLTRIESREIFATFLSSNVFAGFLALSLPITLGLALACIKADASRRFRIASAATLGAAAALEAVLLVLTKSKGGLAAALAGVALFALAALHRLLSKRVFIAVICIAAALLAATALVAFPRAGQFMDEARTSLEVRLGYWRTTGRAIADHFLDGVGPGNFETFYLQHKEVGEREVRDPHNAALLVLAEGGFFSFIFFASFWVLVFAGPRQEANARAPSRAFAAAAALPAAALLQTGLVWMEGGLGADLDLYPSLALLGGAVIGGVFIYYWRRGATAADTALVRAGMGAGILAFLLSSMVDITFSDAGAATVAVFAAAAFAPRGKSAVLKPATRGAYLLAAAVVAGLFVFVGSVFIPYTHAEAAVESAGAYLAAGDLVSARKNAEEALKIDPANPEALRILGNVYEVQSRAPGAPKEAFGKAENYYREALSINCWDRGALEGLARLYTHRGGAWLDDALGAYQRLLEAYPASSRYHLMAARFHERLGLTLEALSNYRRALYIDERTEQHGIQFSDDERDEISRAIARLEEGAAG